MNISWITLRDLEYLVSVAEHQHFGRAAEACHVSQPALSAQIRKVEDVLGVKLFERSNRRVVISAVGAAVAAQAMVVLEEAKKIATLTSAASEPLTGPFRLGVIATLGPYLMPRVLSPLRKEFPKLELLLREGLTESLVQDLRMGALDAVLAAPTFRMDGLRSIPLFSERFLLAASRSHPLARKKPLRTRDLRSEDMVLLEDGHCLRDQTIDICSPSRRGSFREFHATSLETLRHLVASGFGYSLMPQLAVDSQPRLSGLLVYREFDDKPVGRTIVLAFRDRFARMADVEALASFVRGHLPAEVNEVSGLGRTGTVPVSL
jgi:LysR family hydrogen peroxide-inducible transcriptional activator